MRPGTAGYHDQSTSHGGRTEHRRPRHDEPSDDDQDLDGAHVTLGPHTGTIIRRGADGQPLNLGSAAPPPNAVNNANRLRRLRRQNATVRGARSQRHGNTETNLGPTPSEAAAGGAGTTYSSVVGDNAADGAPVSGGTPDPYAPRAAEPQRQIPSTSDSRVRTRLLSSEPGYFDVPSRGSTVLRESPLRNEVLTTVDEYEMLRQQQQHGGDAVDTNSAAVGEYAASNSRSNRFAPAYRHEQEVEIDELTGELIYRLPRGDPPLPWDNWPQRRPMSPFTRQYNDDLRQTLQFFIIHGRLPIEIPWTLRQRDREREEQARERRLMNLPEPATVAESYLHIFLEMQDRPANNMNSRVNTPSNVGVTGEGMHEYADLLAILSGARQRRQQQQQQQYDYQQQQQQQQETARTEEYPDYAEYSALSADSNWSPIFSPSDDQSSPIPIPTDDDSAMHPRWQAFASEHIEDTDDGPEDPCPDDNSELGGGTPLSRIIARGQTPLTERSATAPPPNISDTNVDNPNNAFAYMQQPRRVTSPQNNTTRARGRSLPSTYVPPEIRANYSPVRREDGASFHQHHHHYHHHHHHYPEPFAEAEAQGRVIRHREVFENWEDEIRVRGPLPDDPNDPDNTGYPTTGTPGVDFTVTTIHHPARDSSNVRRVASDETERAML